MLVSQWLGIDFPEWFYSAPMSIFISLFLIFLIILGSWIMGWIGNKK